jgi:hypothetical protein
MTAKFVWARGQFTNGWKDSEVGGRMFMMRVVGDHLAVTCIDGKERIDQSIRDN